MDNVVDLTLSDYEGEVAAKEEGNETGGTSSPRRSGRACKSTTIQIDGHTVLRQNNYSVTASQYIYQADDGETAGKKKKPPSSQNPKSLPQQKRAKTSHPRKPTPAEVARQIHNKHVQDTVEPKRQLQWNFLAKHRERLEPFCEPSVMKKLDTIEHQMKKQPQKQAFDDSTITTPQMVNATLRDYQLRGLEFMVKMHRQNLGMILGDEMGLGKTLQTITLLCHLKEQEKHNGPSLIICPLSVLSSWCHEMQTWAPNLKYFRLHASNAEEQACQKKELAEHATEYDVILTTYEMAKVPTLHSLYQRVHFHYLVLDECQKIKGHQTQLAAAVRKIHKGNTLLLTGTPLQNNLVELWALLNFLYPEVFTTSRPFEEHFDISTNAANGKRVVVDKEFLIKTQQLLELFMLRRLKTEVEKLLPGKLETKIECPLSKTQTFWYKALMLKDVNALANMEADGKHIGATRAAMLRSLFMQLRKCCNHPYVFEGAEEDMDKTSLTDLVAASGKLSVLDMLLQSLFKKGNRAVIFSQFKMVVDLLEDYCVMRGWKYCRFDGSTERAQRNYKIRRFNEPDSPYFLFLITTRSGGMGLNLQSADTCILFDSDWNPQSDIQAMARVHRIGQTKTVHVYRLVSSGTVEERMLERAEKKLMLEMVNKESKDASAFDQEDKARGLSAMELLEDIKFGCEAVFGNAGNNELPSWEDIDRITDRSRKDSDSAGKLKGGMSQSALSFDAEKEFCSTQKFGGADFGAIKKQLKLKQKKETPKNLAGIAHLWAEVRTLDSKRARKSRLMLVDGKGSGYGSSSVPVLASNNYELLTGESSVFERELNTSNKAAFEVQKRKKVREFEHQDFCQICGDGGKLVCCPSCPCSLHLECVGLSNPKQLYMCTHHRCTKCGKNRASTGGLLYPCQSCPNSFCEDCLPEDVTFLDCVERLEKLGFDSTKNNAVYIHCSIQCDTYAREEFGYNPPQRRRQMEKMPLELAYNFGASIAQDLENAHAEIDAKMEEESAVSNSIRTRGGKTVQRNAKPAQKKTPTNDKDYEKLCPVTGVVLDTYDTMAAAARSVGSHGAKLITHLKHKPGEAFEGFVFRPKQKLPLIEKVCPDSGSILEQFFSVNAAATSVGMYALALTKHLQERPDEPFMGFIFRTLEGFISDV